MRRELVSGFLLRLHQHLYGAEMPDRLVPLCLFAVAGCERHPLGPLRRLAGLLFGTRGDLEKVYRLHRGHGIRMHSGSARLRRTAHVQPQSVKPGTWDVFRAFVPLRGSKVAGKAG